MKAVELMMFHLAGVLQSRLLSSLLSLLLYLYLNFLFRLFFVLGVLGKPH